MGIRLEGGQSSIVILGSLNSKKEDRKIERKNIIPVQYIDDEERVRQIQFFNEIGDLGISSMAYDDVREKLYFSTGNSLFVVLLRERKVLEIFVPEIIDVHEISIISGNLWVANTGTNEAIKINLDTDEVVERITVSRRSKSSDGKIHFHCNQIFKDSKGDYYGLVHHVGGRQILRVVRGKMVKSQGDGGIINIHNNERMELKLNAPHTIREVGEEYWIFSSGEQEVRRFSRKWSFLGSIQTVGWGRGGYFGDKEGIYFIGISPIRARYAGIVKASMTKVPVLELIDVNLKSSIGIIEIPNIEQINNVYSIPNKVIDILNEIKKNNI